MVHYPGARQCRVIYIGLYHGISRITMICNKLVYYYDKPINLIFKLYRRVSAFYNISSSLACRYNLELTSFIYKT